MLAGFKSASEVSKGETIDISIEDAGWPVASPVGVKQRNKMHWARLQRAKEK